MCIFPLQLAHEDGTVPDTSVAGVIMAQQEYDRSVVDNIILKIIDMVDNIIL